MRRVLISFLLLFLASCMAKETASSKADELVRLPKPSDAELERYYKIVDLKVEKESVPALKKDAYIHASIIRNSTDVLRDRQGIYVDVQFQNISSPSTGITKSARVPSGAFVDVAAMTRAQAYVSLAERKNNQALLSFAQELAARTICVGRRIVPDDLKPTRVTNPSDLRKIVDVTNGQIFGANINDLGIQGESVPVVDFSNPVVPYGAVVRVKCI